MTPAPNIKTRIQFLLLAALFFVPFIGSYVAFYCFPEYMPKGRTNYGVLHAPAQKIASVTWLGADGQPLSADPLRTKWTLIQRVDGACAEDCLARLVLSRQTRQAMNKNDGRVRRMLWVGEKADATALAASLRTEHPDLVIARPTDTSLTTAFAAAPADALLLVDPLGNWLMHYPAPTNPKEIQADFKGLQKDLNKLLKLSHID